MRILAFSLPAALGLACSKQVTAPQAQHDTGSVPPDGSDAGVPGSDTGIPPPPPPPPPPTKTPPNLGTWSQVMDWPVVAIHSHLLPDGRVLTWGHSGDPTVWDPASGAFQAAPNPIDIFCGGHSPLSDGRVLVTGGNISNDPGLPDAKI